MAEHRFVLTREPLDANEVMAKVLHRDHGATVTFVGTTREHTQGRKTVRLEYEAYVPMAIAMLEQIAAETEERWPGTAIAVSHRLGHVAVGEISVITAVSAPHRAAGYEASRYAIDRLKQIVPIWKKEIWEDGTAWIGHQEGPGPLRPPSG